MRRRRSCRPARKKRRRSSWDKAVNGAELKPLKLERAKFITLHRDSGEDAPGPQPASTAWNSGCRPIPARNPGPMMKVASGGELVALSCSRSKSCWRTVAPRTDAGVRRNRHGSRRRGCRRYRRAAFTTRKPQGAGDGGDACAAGRRARTSSHFAYRQGMRSTKASASPPASTRWAMTIVVRKSRVCWRGAEITAEARAAAERLIKAAG